MSITVLNPGLLTTVQDLGRKGFQQFGVSVSGAMDPRAATIANILVGNEEGEAVLESTMMGPQLQFSCDATIAITGGNLSPTLDGAPILTYCAYQVTAGQQLRFGGPKTGCRAYLAVAGGFDLPMVMGSRSTDLKAKIGGVQGRAIAKGDVVALRNAGQSVKNVGRRSISSEVIPRAVYTVRILLGPQDDYFTPAGISTFLGGEYSVTSQSDRMGCRLDGDVIEHVDAADIISDGIAFGGIQVPSEGKPIIMLADRQTTGGYTKIATVITADFRILGQLKPGDKLRFERVSIGQAQEALLNQRATMCTLRKAMDA